MKKMKLRGNLSSSVSVSVGKWQELMNFSRADRCLETEKLPKQSSFYNYSVCVFRNYFWFTAMWHRLSPGLPSRLSQGAVYHSGMDIHSYYLLLDGTLGRQFGSSRLMPARIWAKQRLCLFEPPSHLLYPCNGAHSMLYPIYKYSKHVSMDNAKAAIPHLGIA